MPGYLTKLERIAITGADDLLIRSLLDRAQFADVQGRAARLGISSATWPLFGLLWPSGALLAARMAARRPRPGERILEIGCGLALASLVGHRRGADVTASDSHPLAGGFLGINLQLNRLLPMKFRRGNWSEAVPAGAALGRFELIMGSDVLYERDASAALAGFIGRHAAAGAEVWIVDPERGNRPAFVRALARLGFALQQQRLDHPAVGAAPAYRGRLLVFNRDAAAA